MKLKPGDTVRVVASRGTAKIRSILTDVHGALLELGCKRVRFEEHSRGGHRHFEMN